MGYPIRATGCLVIANSVGVDDLAPAVRQQWESQTEFCGRGGVGHGRIVTDRDQLDPGRLDGRQIFLEILQLFPAKRTPVGGANEGEGDLALPEQRLQRDLGAG